MKYFNSALIIGFWPIILVGCSPSVENSAGFVQLPIHVEQHVIFDLGISDINGDGRLDIFTSNHSSPQSVLINDGNGAFKDVFANMGLDQDRQIPGLASLLEEPIPEDPGLYINWHGPNVVVRAHQLSEVATVSGRIELFSTVAIIEKDNFDVTVQAERKTPGVSHTVLEFNGGENGHFTFKPYFHAHRITFELDEQFPLSQVNVGPNRFSPPTRKFSHRLRDRHGMAWSDYDRDGETDVFITRGGLRGLMRTVPGMFWDELFVDEESGFRDIATEVGLIKNGCPGRQTAWVDYDDDGRLDVYVVCGRGLESHPNQLFRQQADGRFVDVAGQVGLDMPTLGSFAWLDSDMDGDMDLFWAGREGFYLYSNDAAKFTPAFIGPNNGKRGKFKLSYADFDSDGDLDLFAASSGGNTLFINNSGSYTAQAPTARGLPRKSVTANWIDYNNDGLQDLHTIPGGIFRQRTDGSFEATGLLKVNTSKLSMWGLSDARCSWFDVDNDGTRDLLVAIEQTLKQRKVYEWVWGLRKTFNPHVGKPRFWDVILLRNSSRANNWIQVELAGPPGNRAAIGARVVVESPNGRQMQQVGQAEGSHFSQGHYRLYFGLGQIQDHLAITIFWPDGRVEEHKDPEVNQRLVVAWQPKN